MECLWIAEGIVSDRVRPLRQNRSTLQCSVDRRPALVHICRQNYWRRKPHVSAQKEYRIAVIPGDGIGKEVMPEGLRVLEAAAKKYGFELRLDEFDFSSCDYYAKHGKMLPDDWKEQIGGHDALFFGAV